MFKILKVLKIPFDTRIIWRFTSFVVRPLQNPPLYFFDFPLFFVIREIQYITNFNVDV